MALDRAMWTEAALVYLANHVVNAVPSQHLRLLYYRYAMKFAIGPGATILLGAIVACGGGGGSSSPIPTSRSLPTSSSCRPTTTVWRPISRTASDRFASKTTHGSERAPSSFPA